MDREIKKVDGDNYWELDLANNKAVKWNVPLIRSELAELQTIENLTNTEALRVAEQLQKAQAGRMDYRIVVRVRKMELASILAEIEAFEE